MSTLEYLGHACFAISADGGSRVLIDPYLNGNPAAACRAEEVGRVDLVLVTHGGFDHVGDAFEIVGRTGAMMFASVDVIFAAKARGIPASQLFPMVSGAQRDHAGFHVQAVEARHVSVIEVDGQYISGQPLGYIVSSGPTAPVVYHMGDTSVFSDLRLIGSLYEPDVALVGMGGDPDLPHEMTPSEAALAVGMLGVKEAIPMHYMQGADDPELFVAAIAERRLDVYARPMEVGERLDMAPVAAGRRREG